MKKRNNILVITIAALMICAAFTACSQSDEPAAPNTSDNAGVSDTPAAAPDETENTEDTTPEETEGDTSAAEETSAEETSTDDTTPAPETAAEDTQKTETSIIPENNSTQTVSSSSVAELAKAQEGKPFYFGGADPEQGFDNSGLICYVLNQNGISCPRLTGDIAAMGDKIGYDEIKAGDVVFFEMNGSGNADFGGIYIGEGKMAIAMSEEYPVRIVDITTNYYRDTFRYGIKIS